MIAIVLLIVLIAGSLLGSLLIPLLMVAVAVWGVLGCVGTGLFVGERTVSASGPTLDLSPSNGGIRLLKM